jgi:hypothetical protein
VSGLVALGVSLLMLLLALHGVWYIVGAPFRGSRRRAAPRRERRVSLAVNALVFLFVVRRWRKRRATTAAPPPVSHRPTRL